MKSSEDNNEAKNCFVCDVEKPLTEFYQDRKCRDGRRSTCIECYVTQRQALKDGIYASLDKTGGLECKRCLRITPIDGFRKPPKGHRTRCCIQCEVEKRHEKYHTNPEKFREAVKRSFSKNRTRKNAEKRQSYAENRKEILESRRLNSRKTILRAHGISPAQFEKRLEQQNGGCAICGRTDSGRSYGSGQLLVDHDHKCCEKRSCGNCIRGLLCVKCNAALGFLNDNAELVLKAYNYLKGAA